MSNLRFFFPRYRNDQIHVHWYPINYSFGDTVRISVDQTKISIETLCASDSGLQWLSTDFNYKSLDDAATHAISMLSVKAASRRNTGIVREIDSTVVYLCGSPAGCDKRDPRVYPMFGFSKAAVR